MGHVTALIIIIRIIMVAPQYIRGGLILWTMLLVRTLQHIYNDTYQTNGHLLLDSSLALLGRVSLRNQIKQIPPIHFKCPIQQMVFAVLFF